MQSIIMASHKFETSWPLVCDHMYELWHEFYGGEVDEELLENAIDLVTNIRPDLHLDGKMGIVLKMKRMGISSSLEHLCDILKKDNLLVEARQSDESEPNLRLFLDEKYPVPKVKGGSLRRK